MMPSIFSSWATAWAHLSSRAAKTGAHFGRYADLDQRIGAHIPGDNLFAGAYHTVDDFGMAALSATWPSTLTVLCAI
jgi:hypothetical protein